MVEFEVEIKKRDVYLGLVLVLMLIGIGVVYAYGSGDPAYMGHSADEVVGLGGGCSWEGWACDCKDGGNLGGIIGIECSGGLIKDINIMQIKATSGNSYNCPGSFSPCDPELYTTS